jgi:hypothetical protein
MVMIVVKAVTKAIPMMSRWRYRRCRKKGQHHIGIGCPAAVQQQGGGEVLVRKQAAIKALLNSARLNSTSASVPSTSTENEKALRHDSASLSCSSASIGLLKAYAIVRTLRLASRTVRTLQGCAQLLLLKQFQYLMIIGLWQLTPSIAIAKKNNISASFNLETMACNFCTFRGEHMLLSWEMGKSDELDICSHRLHAMLHSAELI